MQNHVEAHRDAMKGIFYAVYRVSEVDGHWYRHTHYDSLHDAICEANWLVRNGDRNSPHIVREEEISY